MTPVTDPKPLVTLVVAVSPDRGNVTEFLASIGDVPGSHEVLFVSPATAETDEAVRRWVADHEAVARVISAPGTTPADAWNAGLRAAQGEWVGHASTDDRLGEEFLVRVSDFLAGVSRQCAVACAEVTYLDAATGSVLDTHPLRRRFRSGAREVSLDAEPLVVPPDLVGTFVRRDITSQIEIDPALSPFFDGRHFLSRVLLLQDESRLGLLAGARYEQRREMHAKVAIAIDPTNPRRFTELPARGYLDLLDRAEADGRPVPAWLQDTVIHDLRWYVVSERRNLNGFSTVPDAMIRSLGDGIVHVLGRIDVERIAAYDQTPLDEHSRKRLQALHPAPLRPAELAIGEIDTEQGLARITYDFSGAVPREEFTSDGVSVTPVYGKTRRYAAFRSDRLSERIVWIPRGTEITARIDDRPIEVAPAAPLPEVRPRRRWSWRRKADRFADAWILMDRATLAGDNAEHLYRHIAAQHPDINAWFVLERTSPDWQRLSDEGFRLVAFRSAEHREILASAIHFASSHIDPYVYDPFEEKPAGPPSWKFTFLQHGVTKDDVSKWFNGKRIDRLITATRGEHASIVGDGTRYRFTEHEARLTGFPRHDGLLRKAAARSEPASLITFMPTWRRSLAAPHQPGSTMRGVADGFAETEFARSWAGLIGSTELRRELQGSPLQLAVMPHPNLAAGFDDGLVPNDVRRFSYATDDVQEVLAQTAVLVTDYSSVAFDAAVIGRAVLYYQFDQATTFGEGHFYEPGYFSYDDDGFGPVATSADEALASLQRIVREGAAPSPTYEERAERTFPLRDERACERVFDSMLEMRRPGR